MLLLHLRMPAIWGGKATRTAALMAALYSFAKVAVHAGSSRTLYCCPGPVPEPREIRALATSDDDAGCELGRVIEEENTGGESAGILPPKYDPRAGVVGAAAEVVDELELLRLE